MPTRTQDHFDEPEQQRIIALAAQLQRDDANRLSAAELEAAAVEGGIDPKYIQAAIAQVQEETFNVPLSEPVAVRTWSLAPAALLALAVCQIYAMRGEIMGQTYNYVIPIAVAAVFAFFWCPRKFWKGFFAYLVVSFAVLVGVRVVSLIRGTPVLENWLGSVASLFAVQIVAYLSGALFRRVVDSVATVRRTKIQSGFGTPAKG